MNSDYRQTATWLLDKLGVKPVAGIILGTGLNDMADGDGVIVSIPYADIPGFVSSTAPSHKGNLILAEIAGKPIIFLQGRFHYYEGHAMRDVVFPTRVLASMGIRDLIVTNASGSLRKHLLPGSIVQITDHINYMGTNPLIGHNDELLGERFPSMNNPYDPELTNRASLLAGQRGIHINTGVYIAVSGPSLETKAECSAFATWGADLVGMSTVPEVLAARHAGMRVCAFSIVTNYSNLFHDLAHSQDEIRLNASKASADLKWIITELIRQL